MMSKILLILALPYLPVACYSYNSFSFFLPSCCKLQVFISSSQLTIYAAFSLQWTVNVIMLSKRTQYNVDTSIHTILSFYRGDHSTIIY